MGFVYDITLPFSPCPSLSLARLLLRIKVYDVPWSVKATTPIPLLRRRRKHAKLGGKRDMFELNERGAKAGRGLLNYWAPSQAKQPNKKTGFRVPFLVSLNSSWQSLFRDFR